MSLAYLRRQGPVATDAADVRRLAADLPHLEAVDACVAACRACPRLVAWREQVARDRRAAYAGQSYWGRPVPGLGPADASILVLGLAPAAHGGNRTGRVFTGDRSGDWLYAALWRAGLANQPTSVSADDGLALHGVRIAAAVRCAPPANKPTPAERDACRGWLEREMALLRPTLRVVVALGAFAWTAFWPAAGALGVTPPRPRPAFGHGAEVVLPRAQAEGAPPRPGPEGTPSRPGAEGALTLLGCYHVSQQNTFTGTLTEPMLDAVLTRARTVAGVAEVTGR